jgi:uncharacterized membrane protein YqaE (UPF0057 family)
MPGNQQLRANLVCLPDRACFALFCDGVVRGTAASRKRKTRKTMDLLRIILAVVFPPLGVFLQVGLRAAFWINILLTMLGFIPGIVHAIWIIAKK